MADFYIAMAFLALVSGFPYWECASLTSLRFIGVLTSIFSR